MRPVGALLALSLCACNLLVPLDELDRDEGPGDSGGASSATGGTASTGAAGPATTGGSGPGAGGHGGDGRGGGAQGGGGQGGEPGAGGHGGSGDGSYAALVLASNPLVYLRLGEDEGASIARDETGQRDGTYNPGTTRGLPGALVGDPSTAVRPAIDTMPLGAVTLGDVLDFAGTSAFTLECWLRVLDPPGSTLQFILAKDDNPGAEGDRVGYVLGVFPDAGSWVLGFERYAIGEAGFGRYLVGTPLQPRTWHHVVATFEPAGVSMYVDGDLITSGAGSPDPLADTLAPLIVGAGSQGTFPFSGHLDEVAIYGAVLDPETIAAHHAVGSATR